MADETKDNNREAQILAEARARFAECEAHYAEERRKAIEDLQFLDGEQWDARALSERSRDGRPALTVNRMPQFVQHITNAMAQNRIAARVFPVDDVGDPDTAEVIQGHLRHIEANSDGELVYGNAAACAVSMGWGYWMLRQKYVSALSFDTELVLEWVDNPFQVYLDPNHRHPTGKDARYGFKFAEFSEDEYKRLYPNGKLRSVDFGQDSPDGWIAQKQVRIAEYMVIDGQRDTLCRMADGGTLLRSELVKEFGEDLPEELFYHDDHGNRVERETSLETVRCYTLNGSEILDETVFPVQPEYVALPIVKVVGNRLDVNGQQVLKGIIRNLKDAQKQYNFMLSAQTESVDSSKSQIVIEEGDIAGHEQEWENASRRKVLTRTGKNVDGGPSTPPFRLQPNASVPAMTEARLMAADDLKALTGIYDAALGNQSNETSGRAINARQVQSDTANYHYTANLVRSVNHSARLLIGALPTVLDTARAIRIIGQDEQQKVVWVNKQWEEGSAEKTYWVGGKRDGQVGKYDVVCEAGPSPATQKEERAIRMTEMVKVAPQLMNVAPDLILKDLGASHELVERVKKALPPALQEQKDGGPDPAQLMGQLQQMQQQGQQLNAYAQQLEQELQQAKSGVQAKQMEIESRERIEAEKVDLERMRMETQLAIAEINARAQESVTRLKLEMDLASKLHVQDRQHGHEAAMAMAEHAAQEVHTQQAQAQAEEAEPATIPSENSL